MHGGFSICLHWTIAALFFSLAALGAWMTELGYYDAYYHSALLWHRTLGVALLILAAIKIVTARRINPAGLKLWEWRAARSMHFVLFALLLIIPASGYIISTSAGNAAELAGEISLPALFSVSVAARDYAIQLHYWAGYGGVALALLHAAAALKHHFIDKNDVLRRMLPGNKRAR